MKCGERQTLTRASGGMYAFRALCCNSASARHPPAACSHLLIQLETLSPLTWTPRLRSRTSRPSSRLMYVTAVLLTQTGIPTGSQSLRFRDQELNDCTRTLESYGVRDDDLLLIHDTRISFNAAPPASEGAAAELLRQQILNDRPLMTELMRVSTVAHPREILRSLGQPRNHRSGSSMCCSSSALRSRRETLMPIS